MEILVIHFPIQALAFDAMPDLLKDRFVCLPVMYLHGLVWFSDSV